MKLIIINGPTFKAFAWADIVVAPHGAALGLIVYMRQGASYESVAERDFGG